LFPDFSLPALTVTSNIQRLIIAMAQFKALLVIVLDWQRMIDAWKEQRDHAKSLPRLWQFTQSRRLRVPHCSTVAYESKSADLLGSDFEKSTIEK